MSQLQQVIDQANAKAKLKLSPPNFEFEGPLHIRRSITINGQGATVWSKGGPVLSIEADGVVLQNMNLEITGNADKLSGKAACAMVVKQGTKPTLENVTVHGNVLGLTDEEGEWHYPRTLRLQKIPAGQTHRFCVRMYVPVPCQVVSQIDGVNINPAGISGGPSEVMVTIEPLAMGTRLRGTLLLSSAFLSRRIHLTATAAKSDDPKATSGSGQVIWEPKQWELLSGSSPSLVPGSVPAKQSPKGKKSRSKARGRQKQKSIPQKLSASKTRKTKPPAKPVPQVFTKPPALQPEEPPQKPASVKVTSVPVSTVWSPPAAAPPTESDDSQSLSSADTQPVEESPSAEPAAAPTEKQTGSKASRKKRRQISPDSLSTFVNDVEQTPAVTEDLPASKEDIPPPRPSKPKRRKIVKPAQDSSLFGGSND